MMNDVYEKFLKSSEEFIFAENKPEKSDIIFVPGNGYPQMAEKAAELFKKGMADWILPSGKYSVVNGKFSGVLEKSNVYNKEYGTEWEISQGCSYKKRSSGSENPERRSGNVYL